MNEATVQRNYKDTIFRMLFKDKENLLSLYNALNDTAYTDVSGLEITTLENAVYMNYKNDVSFVFDSELMLYEHQSTMNPNMPLRDLFYVSDTLHKKTSSKDLYGKNLIKIPAPRFVVFYNGVTYQPDVQTLKLSNAYEKQQETPELELTVTVYNINRGYNEELMNACRALREYAMYVEHVRTYAKQMPLADAVEKAVDYCIEADILSEFLRKNRAEAIKMSIYEYDEELHFRTLREEGREEGLAAGLAEGLEQGERRLADLLQKLIDSGRSEDVNRAISDSEYRKQLYLENI